VSITGHALNDVRSILDAHYLHRDPELGRAAIHKLELGYAKRLAETGQNRPLAEAASLKQSQSLTSKTAGRRV